MTQGRRVTPALEVECACVVMRLYVRTAALICSSHCHYSAEPWRRQGQGAFRRRDERRVLLRAGGPRRWRKAIRGCHLPAIFRGPMWCEWRRCHCGPRGCRARGCCQSCSDQPQHLAAWGHLIRQRGLCWLRSGSCRQCRMRRCRRLSPLCLTWSPRIRKWDRRCRTQSPSRLRRSPSNLLER
jgi:hypothetical protein